MKSWWQERFPGPVGKQRCGLPWWILGFKVVVGTLVRDSHFSAPVQMLHVKSSGRIGIGGGNETTRNEMAMLWTIKAHFVLLHVFAHNLPGSLQQVWTCSDGSVSSFPCCNKSSCTSVYLYQCVTYQKVFYMEAISNLLKNWKKSPKLFFPALRASDYHPWIL